MHQRAFIRVCRIPSLRSVTQVHFAKEKSLHYDYLYIVTGTSQTFPARVMATDFDRASAQLQTVQENIKNEKRIAVIGGGAVGVEIAFDIKSFFSSKEVTLFHSRNVLMPQSGPKLRHYALAVTPI